MVLSKRERYIIAVTVAAVLSFAFDRSILTPLLDRRAATGAEKQEALRRMENASSLLDQSGRMGLKWQGMVAAGFKGDAGEAESTLMRALRTWSEDSRLTLSSLKPERLAQEGPLSRVSIQVVGQGAMQSVARFLWLVETSEHPLKIEQMQLGSRKEGRDDLSLQLRLSALYIPGQAGGEGEPTVEASTGENP